MIRGAQHFVQQCLDVRIPEIPLEKCLLAEEDGRRSYPLTYESSTQVPLVPNPPLETERVEWIKRYKLHEPELTVSEEWFIPPMRHDSGALLVNERKQSFSSHALLSGRKPLLVRNAQLDVRFRNYKVATARTASPSSSACPCWRATASS
ncbi:Protein RER1A [Phytophthora cinnamomi]|uniref:Protein RER1A n=1 Tax=Phytophthora cinnamomi TaxID=4785 RepID=UPI00355A0DC6|nr:Protein RER1A [Phytophthora cinnamomi]